MKTRFFFIVFFSVLLTANAQEEVVIKDMDSLYREDQFYAGVSYNLIGKKPKELSQNGFSLGFHMGFIRDIPLNKSRNIAIGVGLGYSANSFNQNLLIREDANGDLIFSIIDENDISFSKNKFSQHLLELPIEFRWRTSTPQDYKFWRIYAGFKIGYVMINTAKFRGDLGNFKYNNIKVFNDFQYGLSLSAGYNTWNLYLYYALNPIFSNKANLNGASINMNAVKIGLMFYVL